MTPLCHGALLYLIDEDGLSHKMSPSTLAEVLTEMEIAVGQIQPSECRFSFRALRGTSEETSFFIPEDSS
ncbi:hypothetical protein STENM223S_08582 [Streptomyces tendae]